MTLGISPNGNGNREARNYWYLCIESVRSSNIQTFLILILRIMNLLKTQIGRLRVLAFVEGVSFLVLLFVTMPLKYAFEMPLPNKIFGLIHGLLFVLYVYTVFQITFEQKWNFKQLFWALLASIVPFGTFWADKKLFKPMQDTLNE